MLGCGYIGMNTCTQFFAISFHRDDNLYTTLVAIVIRDNDVTLRKIIYSLRVLVGMQT